MAPLESLLVGGTLLSAGLAIFVRGWWVRRRWVRGEIPSPVVYASFHSPPSAPGGWWIALGIGLGFVGVIMLAPFVASI